MASPSVKTKEFSTTDITAGTTGGTTKAEYFAFLLWREGFNTNTPITKLRTLRGVTVSQKIDDLLRPHRMIGVGYEAWRFARGKVHEGTMTMQGRRTGDE